MQQGYIYLGQSSECKHNSVFNGNFKTKMAATKCWSLGRYTGICCTFTKKAPEFPNNHLKMPKDTLHYSFLTEFHIFSGYCTLYLLFFFTTVQ